MVDSIASPLTPLRPEAWLEPVSKLAGEGSVRESPDFIGTLKGSPPLKQTYFLSRAILLFERGIKGESLNGESLNGVSLDDETSKTEKYLKNGNHKIS